MQLELTRFERNEESVIGRLTLDGAFECFTLENAQLLIDLGTYKVVEFNSPRFKHTVPLLLNVPNRAAIEIHVGNKAANFRGCIGVGTTYAPNWIANSQHAFTQLMSKLDFSDLLISLVEDYPDAY